MFQPGLFGDEPPGLRFPPGAAAVLPDLVQPTRGGQAQVSAPLLYFYWRWYCKRPQDQWPASDRFVGAERYPVTPLSMFAALNFAIATCMTIKFKERADHLDAIGVRTVEKDGDRLAPPADVFTVAVRWVTQCLVTRTGHPYHGGQELHAGLKAITEGNYRPSDGIEAVLPAEWLVLFLPEGFGMLRGAVDEALDFDWWHTSQFHPPPGVEDTGEWYDPLGRYYETHVLK